MKKSHVPAWLILAALAGCGGQSASLGPKSPHGGMMFVLSNSGGVVEVVRQDAPEKPGQARLLLYFFADELKPRTPPPTSATLKPKERGVKAVEFKPTGDADPAKAGELASDPLDATADFTGQLTATVDGKPVAAVLNLR